MHVYVPWKSSNSNQSYTWELHRSLELRSRFLMFIGNSYFGCKEQDGKRIQKPFSPTQLPQGESAPLVLSVQPSLILQCWRVQPPSRPPRTPRTTHTVSRTHHHQSPLLPKTQLKNKADRPSRVIPVHLQNWKVREKTDILHLIRLTWFKIPLYNQLILLLISSSNNKVILRTNEPQELLKPAKLHQSIV